MQLSIRGFLKVRQTDALRQFNFISACWNWYGIKKMPARGWVSAEWREGRRLPRPALWREQFSIPDRGLALYPQNMGKLLSRSLPHPHSQSSPVHCHIAQVSHISRVQPRCPKTVSLMPLWGFDRFLALLLLQIKFYFPVQSSLRWVWCVFDVNLFVLTVSWRERLEQSHNLNSMHISVMCFTAFSWYEVFLAFRGIKFLCIEVVQTDSKTSSWNYSYSSESFFLILQFDDRDNVIFTQTFMWRKIMI